MPPPFAPDYDLLGFNPGGDLAPLNTFLPYLTPTGKRLVFGDDHLPYEDLAALARWWRRVQQRRERVPWWRRWWPG